MGYSCIDDFRSGSDVSGIAKSLLICGMKELLLFKMLFDSLTYYLWDNYFES